MILTDILDFLRGREMASLGEIARHVGAEPGAVRDMLVTLQRKGKVHRAALPGGCGSTCLQCSTDGLEIYALGPQGSGTRSRPGGCGRPPQP